MAAHESPSRSDEWYTPPEVFDAFDVQFDLDVASPVDPEHCCVPATKRITANSLETNWHGFVWMNPPFGGRNGYYAWAKKFVAHGNGIALAPDRTSAPWWQWLASRSEAILFWEKKIKFIKPDGSRGLHPGTGTALFGIGERAVAALERCPGVLVRPTPTKGPNT